MSCSFLSFSNIILREDSATKKKVNSLERNTVQQDKYLFPDFTTDVTHVLLDYMCRVLTLLF